ncbi:MAG: hypothetical protein H6842_04405 [Rhodospirillaceae bacterium]|nr:hypothetical protein [Rhodospirillaceae bacterium]
MTYGTRIRRHPVQALVFLLVLALAGVARAQPMTAEGLAEFMETYYQNPRPAEAMERLAALDVGAFVEADRESAETQGMAILTTFYAHILHAHPELVGPLAARLAAGGRHANALVGAVAMATAAVTTGEQGLAVLEASGLLTPAALATVRQAVPYPFPNLRAISHFDIDLLWVSFFATGDARYITEIAESLTYWEDNPELRLPREYPALTLESQQRAIIEVTMAVIAHNTLTANARRHPAVLAALTALSQSRGDRVGVIAGSIAATVRAGG